MTKSALKIKGKMETRQILVYLGRNYSVCQREILTKHGKSTAKSSVLKHHIHIGGDRNDPLQIMPTNFI